MLVFRSFALGLLGACCLLLAMRPPIAVMTSAGQVVVVSSPTIVQCTTEAPERAESAATVIDVAPGVPVLMILNLIVLAPNERIAAIDDVPVTSAGPTLSLMERTPRRYIDFTVVSDANASRRVLVLLR